MERFENITNAIARLKPGIITATSVAGTYICKQIGGLDHILETLIFFMFLDIVLGFSVAGIKKRSPKTNTGKVGSAPFLKGILKKFGVLVLVAVSYKIDCLMNLDYIRDLTIFAFMAQELLSILENSILLGIKVPEPLKNSLDLLDKKNKQ